MPKLRTRRRGGVPRSRIRRLARQIARRFRPEKIILFGSHAYGRPGPDSDVDMLVVMRTRAHPAHAEAAIARALDADFPLDVIVRTPDDVAARLDQQECFLTEVVSKGQVLYEAHHPRVDR